MINDEKNTSPGQALEAVRNELKAVKAKNWTLFTGCICALGLLPPLAMNVGMSPRFIAISIVFLVCLAVRFLIRNKDLSLEKKEGQGSRQFLDTVRRKKKGQFRWFGICLILFCLWLGYFIGSCISAEWSTGVTILTIAVVLACAIAGLISEIRTHNRVIGIYESLILGMEYPESASLLKEES